MPPGMPCLSLKASFTTLPVVTLLLGLFVLTGGCESSPWLAPPPSNCDKAIIFIHGVTACGESS
jgi:hypothetical protein